MIQVVVLLEIKDIEKFDNYEAQAMKLMAEYSGKLISAFRPDEGESSNSNVQEIHILEFPTIDLFHEFRESPKIKFLASIRDQAIDKTTIYVSNEFINYEKT